MRLIGYLLGCVFAVIAAQIGAWILTFVLAFAHIAGIAAVLLGEDVALSVLGAIGNVIFAVLFGYFIAQSLGWYRGSFQGDSSLIGGGVAAIIGFIFPLLTAGAIAIALDADPRLLSWAKNDTVRAIVVFGAYALVGGLVALSVALVIDSVSKSARSTVTVPRSNTGKRDGDKST